MCRTETFSACHSQSPPFEAVIRPLSSHPRGGFRSSAFLSGLDVTRACAAPRRPVCLSVAPVSIPCHAKTFGVFFPPCICAVFLDLGTTVEKSGLAQLHVICLCCAPLPQKIRCRGRKTSSVQRKCSSDLTPLSHLILKQYVYARNQSL